MRGRGNACGWQTRGRARKRAAGALVPTAPKKGTEAVAVAVARYSVIRPFSARVSPICQYTSKERNAQAVTYQ